MPLKVYQWWRYGLGYTYHYVLCYEIQVDLC